MGRVVPMLLPELVPLEPMLPVPVVVCGVVVVAVEPVCAEASMGSAARLAENIAMTRILDDMNRSFRVEDARETTRNCGGFLRGESVALFIDTRAENCRPASSRTEASNPAGWLRVRARHRSRETPWRDRTRSLR